MLSSLLGHRLDSMTPPELLSQTQSIVEESRQGFITFCNVHMLIEAEKNPAFAEVLTRSIYNTTDGMPLVKLLRWKGIDAHRTPGPDMMPQLCALAEKHQWSVAFYGGSERTLDNLCNWLYRQYPNLNIASRISPPFRALTDKEQAQFITTINDSGAKMLFVGLGCPKQEKWMDKHQVNVRPLMFGVGGAFSMMTGEIKRAPKWIQSLSLEWLFRFVQEPKRLWRRYLLYNPYFIFLLLTKRWRSD